MESSSPTETSQSSVTCQAEETSKNNSRYAEIISTLPKREGAHPSFDFYQYQGFWFPFIFLEAILSMQDNFKAQPTDIFLCSAPKTGATWLKALAFTIMKRDCHSMSTESSLLTITPHECIPLLEADYIQNPNCRDPEVPLLGTHIPYNCLPESIHSSGCKIVYICREPKDTFVSYLQFAKRIREKFQQAGETISPEREFDLFCEGKTGFGPYWDHVLQFRIASFARPEKVLFLKYEDVKADTIFYVKMLAEFMGKPFSVEEERRGVPEEIIDFCSFENLSSLKVNKSGTYRRPTPPGLGNSVFFRNGEVGDWKNHLTEEMQRRIDQITEQKLHGSGLTF